MKFTILFLALFATGCSKFLDSVIVKKPVEKKHYELNINTFGLICKELRTQYGYPVLRKCTAFSQDGTLQFSTPDIHNPANFQEVKDEDASK